MLSGEKFLMKTVGLDLVRYFDCPGLTVCSGMLCSVRTRLQQRQPICSLQVIDQMGRTCENG